MPRNKMTDLRNHLFETLEALKDEEKPMDLDRAKAICNVANTLIESAKVEVKFLEAVDASAASEFFDAETRSVLPSAQQPFEDLRRAKRPNGKTLPA